MKIKWTIDLIDAQNVLKNSQCWAEEKLFLIQPQLIKWVLNCPKIKMEHFIGWIGVNRI